MNKLILLGIAVLGSLSLIPFDKSETGPFDIFSPGDSVKHLVPEQQYENETKTVYQLLRQYHYRKIRLEDSLSSVILDNYLTSLDYNKSFFIQEDIDSFEEYRFTMDESIKAGNLKIPFSIYNVFQDRFIARMDYVDQMLETGFDFSVDEVYEANRGELPWATSPAELNEVWRKSLKSQMLSLKLTGKEDEASLEVLRTRYARYRKVIEQYKPADVYQIFMNAYTESYDPHTNYFNPITAENFDIEMSRSLEGIGARLSKEGDYTIVVDIVPGGPAYKSKKLHADDKIIGVGQGEDGEIVDVVGWRNDDVVQLIRGDKGTVVRLQILEALDGVNAAPKIVRLVREKVNLEEQRASSQIIPFEKNGKEYKLGVITVPDFYKDFAEERQGNAEYNSTTRDVRNLLEGLNAQKIDGLMIDLRRNGGGALDEAIELTGLFIKDGPVVQVRDTQDKIDVGKDTDAGVYYQGPLTVLISRSSASASEIFSGAIQDYKRGVIIGEQTFGKGTVQNLISLNRVIRQNGVKYGNLKLTLAKYYRITGSSTQNVGVTPDVPFPSAYGSEDYGESSMPAALPWDQIGPTEFQVSNMVNEQLLDRLNKELRDDLNSDPELKKLVADIERTKQRRSQTSVSLNESQRKLELDQESRELETRPTVLGGNSSVSSETGSTLPEAIMDDPYLKEGLRLLATIVDSNVG